MFGGIEWEGGDVIWFNRVSDETSRGVRVECDHEEECLGMSHRTLSQSAGNRWIYLTYEMMDVPESFKALFPDRMVCCSVHQEHDE